MHQYHSRNDRYGTAIETQRTAIAYSRDGVGCLFILVDFTASMPDHSLLGTVLSVCHRGNKGGLDGNEVGSFSGQL